MPEIKNIPALRFPEFIGPWVDVALGDLLQFKNGINASKEQYGSGEKFINILDILNNNYITYDDIIGSVDVDAKTAEKYSVEYGDIVFQRSSETREEVGTANVYLDSKSATFGGFVIRGKKIGTYHPRFLNYLLKTDLVRDAITSKSGGSTRYNVSQETLTSIKVTMPTLHEQEKIANFLSSIEDYTERLETQRKLFEQYKKSCVQTLFGQRLQFGSGDGVPFPKWKEKKLQEIVAINKGHQFNKDRLTATGLYPCINGGVEPSGYSDVFNRTENTITISEGGNSCGFVNIIKTKFWCGGHCYTLEESGKGEIYKNYLYQILKYNEEKIMSLRVGSGLPNIQKASLSNLKICIPGLEEQKKIGDFLSSLDDSINILQGQRKMSILLKAGLLQQMFI